MRMFYSISFPRELGVTRLPNVIHVLFSLKTIIFVKRETRNRWQSWCYRKTGCNGMGMCNKKNNVWVKKCMEYEVEGSRPRGRPKRT